MEFGTLSLLKPLVAVGALALGGMGAYNFATTGCPLGTTCDTTEGAAVTAAATTQAESSCHSNVAAVETTLVADAAGEDDCATRCATAAKAAPGLVNFDAETATTAEACEMMKAECDEGAADHCSEAMKAHCDTAGMEFSEGSALVADATETDCSEMKSECSDTATLVADATEADCSEMKSECSDTAELVADTIESDCSDKKSDCEDASDEVAGIETASNDG